MKFTSKEKESIKQAFDLYSEETKEKYDFVEKLDITLPAELEKKLELLIRRRKRPIYYLFNTTLKKVACVITAIIIAAVSTVLSVDALRDGAGNFLLKTYEKFSTLIFNEDSDAPDHIQVYYAPSFIPEGYKMSEIQRRESSAHIEYENNYQKEIGFTQSLISGNGINVNTEIGEVEEIGNGLYICYSQFQQHVYFWSDGEYEFILSASLSISKEELLKIAESLEAQQ